MANATSTKEAAAPRGPVRARPGRKPSWNGLVEYLRGVREELRSPKTAWPSRTEMVRLTQVVLAVIAVVAAYVGSLDAVLTWITGKIIPGR